MQGIEELASQVDRKIFVDGSEITRKSLVSFILEKHRRKLKESAEERKRLAGEVERIRGEVEEEKKRRDELNRKVQELKRERQRLKEENRQLRGEFFRLIEAERKNEPPRKEVKLYRKYIEDLEWKLQTEAITLETEKRILKEMREAYAKLKELTHPEKIEEINQRIAEITKRIGENMARIEELHTEMAGYVEESNVHHQRYVEGVKGLRELESRMKWLEHVSKREEEAIQFWSEMGERMSEEDRKDSERPFEEVLSILEKFYATIEEKRSAEEEEEMELKKKAAEGEGRRKEVKGGEMGGEKRRDEKEKEGEGGGEE